MVIKTKTIIDALHNAIQANHLDMHVRIKAEVWCGSDKCPNCGEAVELPEEIDIDDIESKITKDFPNMGEL
jgi:hypothetical protein